MSSKMDKITAKYNLRNKKYRKKVPPPPPESSSSDNDTVNSDEETIYSTSSELSSSYDEETTSDRSSPLSKPKFNRKDFQNLLAQMFPSKYIDSKVGSKSSSLKTKSNKQKESKDTSSKSTSSSRKKKERLNDSDRSDIDIESSESDEPSVNEEENESDIEPRTKKSSKKGENINIIFTIGKGNKSRQGSLAGSEDYDDESFVDDDSYEESDDESQCNSEDEKAFMKETYEEIEPVAVVMDSSGNVSSKSNPDTDSTVISKKKSSSNKSSSSKHKESEKEEDDSCPEDTPELPEDIESEYVELLEIKKRLTAELAKRPTNKILKRSVQECTDSIRKLIKQARRTNTRKYRKLIYEDTKPINEMEYFKRKLSHKEQKQAMDELNEIYSHIYTEKPYRLALIQSKMPSKFKAIAMQKLNVLKTMEPSDSEYYKIKNWVDTFMKIPFGIYKSVSVSINDGVENCNQFLVNAKQTLDNCTYGLNDAKMQIMQMLGQWMVNPVSIGSAIAIHGPMGTGKTTLVKEGISNILGREFTFIALGGGGDASFLEGHSYTYEGSTWGKIVQILIDSKCMNPVIYFDELDKVSDTPRGQEIIGILTHLIDTSQNTQYHDKYFSEIDFDLSKCLFIFSYNDENLVNPILRDRMYHIRTKGYESKDKVVIARNYLLPKIREQLCFSETDVILSDEMIQYVVSTFTKSEMGVRNLKRCLEIIYSKLNLFRLVSADNKMFTKDMNLSVSFPITVTKKEIDVFVKTDEVISQSMLAMYV
jgi:ATP-dependent Lon protease